MHLPTDASWPDQVEIYFSVLQRKAITPDDSADLNQLATRIVAFQDRYNDIATPFNWTYTRHDLNQFLNQLQPHTSTPQSARPQAA